ncbi:MAG: prefoldin subunit beta [Candidatus Altiarchaeales archaeon]|nr:MAG: prefoldin subunit beta [Candidatus Altiarchaeales archaeon]
MEIPRQLQDKIAQFQEIQNQLQAIALQRQQFILQSRDIENALSELEKFEKGKIYESLGPIMIETTKEKSEKKLKEEKETLDARIKILEKQEKKLNEKLRELGEEIQSSIRGGGGLTAG